MWLDTSPRSLCRARTTTAPALPERWQRRGSSSGKCSAPPGRSAASWANPTRSTRSPQHGRSSLVPASPSRRTPRVDTSTADRPGTARANDDRLGQRDHRDPRHRTRGAARPLRWHHRVKARYDTGRNQAHRVDDRSGSRSHISPAGSCPGTTGRRWPRRQARTATRRASPGCLSAGARDLRGRNDQRGETRRDRRRNPQRIRDEAALAALCGASPIPASSGNSIRHRLNLGGDRRGNSALHRTALVHMQHGPTCQAYIARHTAEGKPSARSCVA